MVFLYVFHINVTFARGLEVTVFGTMMAGQYKMDSASLEEVMLPVSRTCSIIIISAYVACAKGRAMVGIIPSPAYNDAGKKTKGSEESTFWGG